MRRASPTVSRPRIQTSVGQTRKGAGVCGPGEGHSRRSCPGSEGGQTLLPGVAHRHSLQNNGAALFPQRSQPTSQTPPPPSPFLEKLPCQPPGPSAPPYPAAKPAASLSPQERGTEASTDPLRISTFPVSLPLVHICSAAPSLATSAASQKTRKSPRSHLEIWTVIPHPGPCRKAHACQKRTPAPQQARRASSHGPCSPTAQPHSPLLAALASRQPWTAFRHLYGFISFLVMQVTTLRGLRSSD